MQTETGTLSLPRGGKLALAIAEETYILSRDDVGGMAARWRQDGGSFRQRENDFSGR